MILSGINQKDEGVDDKNSKVGRRCPDLPVPCWELGRERASRMWRSRDVVSAAWNALTKYGEEGRNKHFHTWIREHGSSGDPEHIFNPEICFMCFMFWTHNTCSLTSPGFIWKRHSFSFFSPVFVLFEPLSVSGDQSKGQPQPKHTLIINLLSLVNHSHTHTHTPGPQTC